MRRHLSSLSGKFAEDASRCCARFQASSGHSDSANWPGYKAEPNHNNVARRCRAGAKIFLGGGALVSCSTSTPINHIVFFWQNTSCIRKPQVISGGGGAHSLHPPPRSAPALSRLPFVLEMEKLTRSNCFSWHWTKEVNTSSSTLSSQIP